MSYPTAPGDYQQTVALLTFNSTVNRLCTTIEVVDDNVFESDEVFYVIIGDTNSSITISPESGVVTIEDNDGKPWMNEAIAGPSY